MNKIEIKIKYIVNWLKDYLVESKMDGFVFGISGGIDSALLAYILAKHFPNNSLAYIMNIENSKQDIDNALLVAKSSKIKYAEIDIETTYFNIKNILPNNITILGNVKSRLRMITLYAFAQNNNMLVLGTSNADEYYTGYFTKYGDSGSDLLPLVNLTKSDIYSAAKYFNIPNEILIKKPSAGLYEGQTDEEELKVSYNDIDNFLLKLNVSKDKNEIIKKLHKNSKHKRILPMSPKKKGILL